jgi:hypothetical protein
LNLSSSPFTVAVLIIYFSFQGFHYWPLWAALNAALLTVSTCDSLCVLLPMVSNGHLLLFDGLPTSASSVILINESFNSDFSGLAQFRFQLALDHNEGGGVFFLFSLRLPKAPIERLHRHH